MMVSKWVRDVLLKKGQTGREDDGHACIRVLKGEREDAGVRVVTDLHLASLVHHLHFLLPVVFTVEVVFFRIPRLKLVLPALSEMESIQKNKLTRWRQRINNGRYKAIRFFVHPVINIINSPKT